MRDTTHSGLATGGSPTTMQPATAPSPALAMRAALTQELRVVPATLVVGLLAAAGAASVGPKVWFWLAAFALNAVLRGLLAWFASRRGARSPVAARERHLHAASYGIELALWAVLLLAIAPLSALTAGPVGAAAAAGVLLAALALGQRRALWLTYCAGWVAVLAALVLRHPQSGALAAGFALWLLAVSWFATAPRRAAERAPGRRAQTGAGPDTRIGWRHAVLAMPSPTVVIRAGRVVDLNDAAARFIGGDARSLIGVRIEDCLRPDPADAFDPLGPKAMRDQVQVLPAHRTFDDVSPWLARVQVVVPGNAASRVVIALARPEVASVATAAVAAGRWAEDARRLGEWIGGLQGEPWYRDERGSVFLPSRFHAPMAGSAPALDFPLESLLPVQQRAAVNASFREARRRNGTFDRVLWLQDRAGELRRVRVVCISHEAQSGGLAPVIGVIAPTHEVADDQSEEGALLARLPVLIWLVDGAGRVVRVQGADGWRWGLQQDLPPNPLWRQAFALRDAAAEDLGRALARALAGKPTFDLINGRMTLRGGRIVLRSHVVPFTLTLDGRSAPGALVLDTIAAPQQLTEIDRLRQQKAQYRALVDASASLIWACDSHFRFTFVSRRAARDIYGLDAAELIGKSIAALLAPQLDQTAARQALARLRMGQSLRDVEMVQQANDGQRVVVAVSAAPLKGSDGVFAGALGMNADLTMLKQRERRLTEALRIERTVLDAAGQAIAVVKDGVAVRCNDAFLHLLAAQPAQLARTPIGDYFAGVGEWQEVAAAAEAGRASDRATSREVLIQRGARGGGPASWCQLTARSIAPDEYVLVLADIDHIRNREAEALHHAQHDELTGLPNRRLLSVRATAALSAAGLRTAHCALIAIDLDGFKDINDQHGHQVGDAALREVAQRLSRVLRPQDTVARRGGDEFAMLVPDAGGREDVERIAARVLRAIDQPMTLPGGQAAQLSASLGIAIAPDHGRDLERLLNLADQAMYEAKQRGKNRYAFVVGEPVASGNVTALASRAARLNGG